ncbi:probable serine/threonine-protein kinase DDB_G0278845 [Episyrphus balteatus]|uniref:probable serine/threonine-protein kinase DDB_G0278845 n=1 Tax=Episyrphus balteatus TaxID=286459 RepID=UPI002484FC68|nr:probable serine/threonine-protein kinase DDB_G0278845 [Episyrphus balteatus]
MRSLICCRNPQSLESAITILHECGYAHYNPYNKSLTPKLNTQQHKDTDTAIQKKRPMNPNTSWQPRSFNHQYMNPSFESYRPNNFNTSWQPRTTNNNYIKPPFDHYRSNNTSYNANRQPNNNNYIKPPFEHNRPHPNNYNNTQHYNSNNQNQNPFRNSNNSNNRNTQEPMEIGLAQRRPLKFIIDTGATHSIINPEICHPKWHIDLEEPLNLKTLSHNIKINKKAQIPLFSELGDSNIRTEFLICQFHTEFDGLIGNNILTPLEVNIDYKNKLIKTKDKIIELHFNNKVPTSVKLTEIDVPVKQEKGLGYINETILGDNLIIKEGIYNIDNYVMIANAEVIGSNTDLKKILNYRLQMLLNIE